MKNGADSLRLLLDMGSFRSLILKLKDQARDDTPMHVVVGGFIDGKDKAESGPGLDRADRFEVEAKSDVPQKAVVPGIVFIQFRFADQLENRNEFLHAGQGQGVA